jgi:hypothetical protein
MDDDQTLEQLLKSKVLPSEGDDIDGELEALLREDQQRSNSFKDLENIDFIQDFSVFDPMLKGSEPELDPGFSHADPADLKDESEQDLKPPESRLSDMLKARLSAAAGSAQALAKKFLGLDKKYWAIIALSAMIALTFTTFLALRAKALQTPGMAEAPEGSIILAPPSSAVNDSSYIYVSGLDGELGQRLSRFAFGPLSSMVYLNGSLEQGRSLSMRSLDGSYVGRDLAVSLPGHMAAFRPLGGGASGFSLEMSDSLDKSVSKLDFALSGPVYGHVRSLVSPLSVYGDSLDVVTADFSNTASTICLRFTQTSGGALRLGEGFSATLTDGASPLFARSPAWEPPIQYSKNAPPATLSFNEESIVFARFDFEPPRSLDGTLILGLHSLFVSHSPDSVMDTEDLFGFATKGPQTMSLGDHLIVFEGMQRQGRYIVLVLHCETSSGDRVEVQLDSELIGAGPAGDEMIFEGRCLSGPQGADVLYEIGASSPIRLSAEDIKVRLKSFRISVPDLAIPLDLSKMPASVSEERLAAEARLEQSFLMRLRYKSKRLGLSDVAGFTPGALTQESLLPLYEPVGSASEYSAQTVVACITGGVLRGGVNEEWRSTGPGKGLELKKRHRIKAVITKEGWIITKDELEDSG